MFWCQPFEAQVPAPAAGASNDLWRMAITQDDQPIETEKTSGVFGCFKCLPGLLKCCLLYRLLFDFTRNSQTMWFQLVVYKSKVCAPGLIPVSLSNMDKPNVATCIFHIGEKDMFTVKLDQFAAGEEFRSPWQLGSVYVKVVLRSKYFCILSR